MFYQVPDIAVLHRRSPYSFKFDQIDNVVAWL